MISPWLLQYQIRQGILHSTTICHGFIQTRGMANITCKVNRNMIQGHVAESKLRKLTEDLRDNGIQLTLSICLHHLKNLRVKRLMSQRTGIFLEQILVPYKE
jgi:hypothetical protein